MKNLTSKTILNRAVLVLLALALYSAPLLAQVPKPADPQQGPMAIMNATLHLGNGQVIENGIITFNNGKIEKVGPAANIKVDLRTYQVVQARGKHVYPGLILPDTDLGLVEIGAVRATVDNSEVGSVKPHVRSIVAYNTDSELIPTLRFNGIAYAQIAPRGGRVTGSSSVVKMDAWNWEDAAMATDEGIHMNWPRMYRFRGWWSEGNVERNKGYNTQIEGLKAVFKEALAYTKLDKPAKINLRFEAMRGLYNGSTTLYISADDAKEMIDAVNFAQEMGVKRIVLKGCRDAWLIKDFLKDRQIPLILPNVHRLPKRAGTDVDMPYKVAGMLHKEGILVCLGYNGIMNSRNLPFFAGTAAAHGLDKEEALKLVTLNAARIMGLQDRLGSLEPGKEATFVISNGDLLDMLGNDVTQMFIQGGEIDLNGKQQMLYKRFSDKYQKQD